MIEAPKRSRREIAYTVALFICMVGFILIVLIGLITGSQDAGLFLLGFVSFAGIFLFRRRVRKIEQRGRDEYALRLFNSVRSGEIANFAIFLRPFFITGRIRIAEPTTIYMPGGSMPAHTTYHLEETLIQALSMPLLALGRPGEVYGAARILTDEDSWKSAVYELMRQASIILCMPSGHPGSQWELDEIIRNQYLGKTVFLMPRDPSLLWFKWKHLRNDWDAVVTHMKSYGLRIPPYDRDGLLFSIRPTGCFIEEFGLTSSERLGAAIGRLSSAIPSSRRFNENKSTRSFVARGMAALKRLPFR